VAAAASLAMDDYVLVGLTSSASCVVTLDQWLHGLADLRIHSYRAEVMQVRAYGDSAVALVQGSWDIVFQGQEIDEDFLVSDLWIRRAEGWKIVLRHLSPWPR